SLAGQERARISGYGCKYHSTDLLKYPGSTVQDLTVSRCPTSHSARARESPFRYTGLKYHWASAHNATSNRPPTANRDHHRREGLETSADISARKPNKAGRA